MNQLVIKKRDELSKRKKGFTLVELIIVIAIIAILSAIAIPKFGEVRTNANKKADIANAKTIATAVANAVSNGATNSVAIGNGDDGYLKYIDGSTAIKSKVTPANQLTPSINDGGNILVKSGDDQVYPIPSDGTYSGN